MLVFNVTARSFGGMSALLLWHFIPEANSIVAHKYDVSIVRMQCEGSTEDLMLYHQVYRGTVGNRIGLTWSECAHMSLAVHDSHTLYEISSWHSMKGMLIGMLYMYAISESTHDVSSTTFVMKQWMIMTMLLQLVAHLCKLVNLDPLR